MLWRPTGPEELALVEQSGWSRWRPRLTEQPIFYPVLNEWYATKIAREWNVPASGVGYVTRFQVRTAFLGQYETHQIGGRDVMEYWIPAEDVENSTTTSLGSSRSSLNIEPSHDGPSLPGLHYVVSTLMCVAVDDVEIGTTFRVARPERAPLPAA